MLINNKINNIHINNNHNNSINNKFKKYEGGFIFFIFTLFVCFLDYLILFKYILVFEILYFSSTLIFFYGF